MAWVVPGWGGWLVLGVRRGDVVALGGLVFVGVVGYRGRGQVVRVVLRGIVMPSSGVLAVDYGTLAQVDAAVRGVGVKVLAGESPLGAAFDGVIAGSGDFHVMVEWGATAFLLAWREVVKVTTESLATIANNVGSFTTDVQATDVYSDLPSISR